MAIDTTKPLVLMGGAPSLERTMKETGYDPDGVVLAAGGIPEYTDEKVNEKVTPAVESIERTKGVSIALCPDKWSSNAPYT